MGQGRVEEGRGLHRQRWASKDQLPDIERPRYDGRISRWNSQGMHVGIGVWAPLMGEKNIVNRKPVTAHIYEYTTQGKYGSVLYIIYLDPSQSLSRPR